ncbi:MAG: hypothetical protein RLZ10_375, partial [Bacteroidota bacterium]
MFEGEGDKKDTTKKSALEEIKGVIGEFATEIGDALATNINPDRMLEKLFEVDDAAKAIAKSFGLGTDNIVNLKASMTNAVTEVTKLGGNFEKIAQIQQTVGESVGRNVVIASEAYAKLYAAGEVSGKQAAEFVPKFKDVGISIYQAGTQMEKIVNTAREIGVNVGTVTGEVMKHMDKLNLITFQGGVEGLAKMAAHATSINMDMGKTLEFAEKVYNPEGAIETAAALQRLGVTQSQLLDPLRLMDLSQNDPEELQKQIADLGKDFVKLNEKGQFEIIKGEQRRLKEVAKELGMMPAEFAKMAIGAKELEDKLQKIKFPDTITEEQKNFIANMAEMNEKGQYVIEYKGEAREVNDLLKEFGGDQKKLEEFMKDSQPKSMEDLATQQLTTLQAIKASIDSLQDRGGYAIGGSEIGQDAIEAVVAGYKKTAEAFDQIDIKGMRKVYDEGATDFVDTLNRVIRGEDSVEAVFTSLTNTAKKTSSFLEEGFQSAIESAKKSTTELSESQNKFAQMLTSVYESFKKNEGITPANQNVTPANTATVNVNPNLNQVTTNNMGATGTNTQTMTTNSNSNISLNIKIDAPPGVDTAML